MVAVAMVLQYPTILAFPQQGGHSTKAKARKRRFTQAKVEAFQHGGGGPEYLYDTEKPGLAVRLTSGGARTFVFVGRLHGKVARITLGRVESLPLAKARAAIDKIRGDVALGIDVIAQRKLLRRAEAVQTILDQAFGQFVAGNRHRPKTARDYHGLWSLYVASRLGKKTAEAITSDDVKKLHAHVAATVIGRRKIRTKGEALPPRAAQVSDDWKGHRTANKVVSLVRAVLAFAGREADNPAGSVAWFKQSPRRRRLSDSEASTFRRALENFEPVWREFFMLSLLTGARRQSLLAMRWIDINLEKWRWVIPATWSKHGDEMVVPLTREAGALLLEMKERRGASPWVFPSEKAKSGHLEEPKAAWSRLLQVAEIADLRLHDLRRTFGSRLAETGASGAVIAAAMGHKSLQSARSYLHLQVDAVREAAERAAIKPSEGT
jgi:integrase